MIDVLKIEKRFNQWRGWYANGEQYVLNIATKIASFNNTNDLQNIQAKLTIDSAEFKDFDDYREKKQLSCLFGTLFYMKLVIEDYAEGHGALSEDEKQQLKNVLATLDGLYNYTYIYTGTKLETLTRNINFWLENHALNNDNKDKTKELCLAFYTIITIINLNLETIPEEYFGYVNKFIGDVNNRKNQMATLLNTTADIIAQIGRADIHEEEEVIEYESDEVASIHSEEEDIESSSDGELGDRFLNTNPTGTPEPLEDEEHFDNSADVLEQEEEEEEEEELSHNLPHAFVQENEEDPEEFFDAVSEQPAPITLEARFDALSLDILTDAEGTLQEKIERLKTSLDQTREHLNRLRRQKTETAELRGQFNLAATIDNVCQEETYAHDIVRKNKDNIDKFLMLIPSQEQELWKQRLEKIPAPDFKKATAHTLTATATVLCNLMPQSSILDSAKSNIPKIDGEFKRTLQRLAQTHMETLGGRFDINGERLLMGTLHQLEEEIQNSINELANGDLEATLLLKNKPLIELEQLANKINMTKEIIVEYDGLVNQITEARAKLKTAAGIDADIDIFLSSYDGFLVRLSLFVSQYLGAFFKTATADKIDKVSVIKTQIRESKIQLENTFEEALNSIKNNQQISETIKTEFVAKLEASFIEEAPAPELNAQANAPELEAPEVPQAAAERNIGREFNNIQDRFRLFAPAPPPVVENAHPPLEYII